jgi:hypothetical protein
MPLDGMADYVVTAANVAHSSSARVITQTAGATITRGQLLYLDTSSGTVKLFKANGAAPQNQFYGIALEDCASGQDLLVCTSDPSFTPGFSAAAGQVVIGSGAVAGNAAPVADNATGWYTTILGVMKSATVMNFSPVASGVAT